MKNKTPLFSSPTPQSPPTPGGTNFYTQNTLKPPTTLSSVISQRSSTPTHTTHTRNTQYPLPNTPKPKLRESFPFLSAPTCPPELKILAANKITAYHTYCAAHAKLYDCHNLTEQFETVSQLVEAYIENRKIFDEFRYYTEHGTVLGQHPIFKEYQELKALRKLSAIDLYKTQQRLIENIRRIQNQLKSKKKPHLRPDRQKSLTTKQTQLQEITRLLS